MRPVKDTTKKRLLIAETAINKAHPEADDFSGKTKAELYDILDDLRKKQPDNFLIAKAESEKNARQHAISSNGLESVLREDKKWQLIRESNHTLSYQQAHDLVNAGQ
ncbi:MAG: hypothetical protein AAB116_18280 [Candidatus Poribacteria bacterium]